MLANGHQPPVWLNTSTLQMCAGKEEFCTPSREHGSLSQLGTVAGQGPLASGQGPLVLPQSPGRAPNVFTGNSLASKRGQGP